MNKLLSKFLTTGLFFYAISVLARFGYNSAYNVPYQLISPSISDTILFLFSIVQGLLGTILGFIIFFGLYFLVPVIYKSNQINRIGIVLIFLFGSYLLGTILANVSERKTIDHKCITDGRYSAEYELVDIFGDKVVLDMKSSGAINEKFNGIIVKNITSLKCGL